MKEKRTWKSGTDKEVNRKLHMMEIGSIYEINPATVAVAEESQTPLFSLKETEKYGKKNVSFTASGRAAIALALKSYAQNRAGGNKTEAGKKCLLPAYMCDTVFFPFQWEGWEIQSDGTAKTGSAFYPSLLWRGHMEADAVFA